MGLNLVKYVNMKKEIKFVITFLAISTLLYFITLKFYSVNLPIIGTTSVAFVLNKILNFIGISSIIRADTADTIYLPNKSSLVIILECTGVYEMIMLSSIIVSYPTNIMKKLYGIGFGFITIYGLNMVRLVSMSYVLAYYIEKFDFIDRYLWQISLIVFISLTYTIWLKLIERSNSSSV